MGHEMKKSEQVSPPVTWFGSKNRLVKEIVKYFSEHQTYVDVFGGIGAVLLGKRPSKVEVYNDLNRKMTSLFNVLSDKRKTHERIRSLEGSVALMRRQVTCCFFLRYYLAMSLIKNTF